MVAPKKYFRLTNKSNLGILKHSMLMVHFFCLCSLGLTVKQNFNISKVAYSVKGKDKEIYSLSCRF